MQQAIRILFIFMVLAPPIVLAGGNAELQMNGRAMDVYWDDADNIRVGGPEDSRSVIVDDGVAYALLKRNNQLYAFEWADILAMQGKGSPPRLPGFDIHFAPKDGADSATIAGVQGQAFIVTITDGNGKQRRMDTVLTSDPLTVSMTQVLSKLLLAMQNPDDEYLSIRQILANLPDATSGLLKGPGFQVQSIVDGEPAASLFAMPAKLSDPEKVLQ